MSNVNPLLQSYTRHMRAALRSGDMTTAETLLDKLRQEAPGHVVTRGFELELLLAQQQLQLAAKLADQLTTLFPQSSRIHYLAGRVAFRQKQYDKALAAFKEGHSLHPHWKTLWWQGKTLVCLNHLDQARTFLEEVHEIRPDLVLGDLAWLYERMGRLDEALQFAEQLLAREPDSDYAKQRVMHLRAALTDPEELAEELNNLMELGEDVDESLLREHIENLFQAGQTIEARRLLEASLSELSPNTAVHLGWVCHRHQAYDLAYKIFTAHFEQHLYNVKFLNVLQADAGKIGRLEDLISLYEQHATKNKGLYGRMRALAKKVNVS